MAALLFLISLAFLFMGLWPVTILLFVGALIVNAIDKSNQRRQRRR